MTAIAERVWGSADLRGRRIAIKGVGKVGMSLAERLHARGAELVVADVDEDAVAAAAEDFGAKIVPVEDIHRVDCDIFSPCALGADLNPASIPKLACSAIAGSANNQLLSSADADRIAERGILYAPDFVVNAGGIINIAAEHGGYDVDRAAAMVDAIHDNLEEIFRIADDNGVNTEHAAEAMADERIDAARRVKGAKP